MRSLSRRAFLEGSSTSLAALALGACRARPKGPAPPSAPNGSEPELSLVEARDRIARGQLSSAELVDAYLGRIDAVDRSGPTLRSVVETNPDARAIAAERDRERARGVLRGPLHGVPVLLKDNIDTADRMATTAGSLALLGAPAARDAGVVERLRAAGAVLLGKTNMSEWANARDSHATSGWSARGGLTKNPYGLDRSPGGSSSGSAVAVAANLAAGAIGTETNGSILGPSALSGIVGVKPTVGLVSRSGIVPLSSSQDTAGPMTRTVADAALLLDVIAGVDARDPATTARPTVRSHLDALSPDALRGKRIAIVRGLAWVTPALEASFEASLAVLRAQGATLVDPVELPPASALDRPEQAVLAHEFKAGLERYLAERRRAGVASVADLIRFNEAHRDRELVHFGQDYFERVAEVGGLESREYTEGLAACRKLAREDGIDGALARHACDALVAPTAGIAWVVDLLVGDHFTGGLPHPAIAGYPSVTVPSGFVHRLPVGLQFFASAYAEPLLLGLAYAFERATRARRPPTYAATLTPPP